ncbi:MAG: class I SAM-dependent methyltransferase [Candidatus Methylomirabilaceae bacterium]
MLTLPDMLRRLHARVTQRAAAATRDEELRRTGAHWGAEAGTWRVGRGLHWTEHALVQGRINAKVSGDPTVDPYGHFVRRYLDGRLPVERSLTLGCGEGLLERGLAQYDLSLHYEGVDVASEALRSAEQMAPANGPSTFSYRYMDLNDARLDPERYDVIFGANSVHHVEHLEHLFREVWTGLKPGGYFHLNEYVGPSRFQWTDRQQQVINGLLIVLPERYRISMVDRRGVKRRLTRPTVRSVKAIDPSEAARSAEIVGLLREYFEVVEVREVGGTILHPLLDGIAGNFDPEREEDRSWLQWLFQTEDALLAAGEIRSDFAVMIATKAS